MCRFPAVARTQVLFVICASCVLLLGCSSTTHLTDQEMAKIDPHVQRVLAGERVPGLEELSSLRADGSREYPVVVRTTNPKELDALGITPHSRFGDMITVRVTAEEIKKLAQLGSVTAIRAGAPNEPQSTID